MQLVFVIPILWLAIYPVDSIIQPLNNQIRASTVEVPTERHLTV